METLHITATEWSQRAQALRDDGWLLMDLCGLDRLGMSGDPRFEIVVQLISYERKQRMALHVTAAGEVPSLPSVTRVWPTANFFEREAYDMFGITFEGHPNLTRILMPDEWEGYPLRKDYGVGKVPVEFVTQPFLQTSTRGQAPTGEEAGSDVDELGQSEPPGAGDAT